MRLFTRTMLAASVVSLAGSTIAKADVPDVSVFGSASLLQATSTQVEITFMFARADFTNNLVLFTAVGGTNFAGTGNPIITVPGNYPNPGVGAPHSVIITVPTGVDLLFGICSSGGTFGGGTVATACTAENATYRAYYMGPGSNNANDNQIHAAIMTAAQWNAAATASGCLAESPPCFLAGAGTTVVGFEDLPNPGTTSEPGSADFNDLVFSFSNVSTVPEPGTMGLLALGLVGLSGAGLLRRRVKKNR